ncbi:MAG: LysR family transcriptional regulator [Betaproteobacteria bacterium]|nr:LysR family transcriptional regulator [Betaproteobacteria bacterium]
MDKLTHRQIETFRAVMITGSFTVAAEMLRTSQPTTSRVISELAEAVGFALFRRQGRRVTPTADGRALFESVEAHYRGLEEIEVAAARIRRFDGASLRIASVTSMALSLLPVAIDAFRRELPHVPITVSSGNHDTILGQLVNRQCDLGLAIMPDVPLEVDAHPIARVQVVAVLARDNPLASREGISMPDLAKMPLIMVARHLSRRADHRAALHRNRRPFRTDARSPIGGDRPAHGGTGAGHRRPRRPHGDRLSRRPHGGAAPLAGHRTGVWTSHVAHTRRQPRAAHVCQCDGRSGPDSGRNVAACAAGAEDARLATGTDTAACGPSRAA